MSTLQVARTEVLTVAPSTLQVARAEVIVPAGATSTLQVARVEVTGAGGSRVQVARVEVTTPSVLAASAGADRGDVPALSTVVLDGRNSTTGDGGPILAYEWTQPAGTAGGTPVVIDFPGDPIIYVQAPGGFNALTFAVQLRVRDSTGWSDYDRVNVSVLPATLFAPVGTVWVPVLELAL